MKHITIKVVVPCLFFFFTLFNANAKTINVLEFGAIGDGKFDNTEVFNRIFKSLKNGDILVIPKGIFVIESLIISNLNNLSILGEGTLKAIKKGSPYFVTIVDCPKITLSNINIDCSNIKNLGLEIVSSPFSILDGISISNVFGYNSNWAIGLRVKSGTNSLVIKNIKIDNINSLSNAATGIYIYQLSKEKSSNDIQIQGAEIFNISSIRDADGIKIQQINKESNIFIVNCKFFNNKTRAIKIQTNSVTVSNNLIWRNVLVGNGFSAVSIYGNNIKVLQNKVYSEGNSSLNMFADIGAVTNIEISDNSFSNSDYSTSNVIDFLDTRKLSTDSGNTLNFARIISNNITNVRNFLRVGCNINNCVIESNNIKDLKSNFIHIRDDSTVENVKIKQIKNMISYRRFKYKEVYQSKNSKVNVVLN